MLKVNYEDPGQRHWRCSGVFKVNFKHISRLVLVFLLLTLSRLMQTDLHLGQSIQKCTQ